MKLIVTCYPGTCALCHKRIPPRQKAVHNGNGDIRHPHCQRAADRNNGTYRRRLKPRAKRRAAEAAHTLKNLPTGQRTSTLRLTSRSKTDPPADPRTSR